jgi:hypothetical protein
VQQLQAWNHLEAATGAAEAGHLMDWVRSSVTPFTGLDSYATYPRGVSSLGSEVSVLLKRLIRVDRLAYWLGSCFLPGVVWSGPSDGTKSAQLSAYFLRML